MTDPYAWTTAATVADVRDRLTAAWSPVPCCDCPAQVHHDDGRCALCPCRGNQPTTTEGDNR